MKKKVNISRKNHFKNKIKYRLIKKNLLNYILAYRYKLDVQIKIFLFIYYIFIYIIKKDSIINKNIFYSKQNIYILVNKKLKAFLKYYYVLFTKILLNKYIYPKFQDRQWGNDYFYIFIFNNLENNIMIKDNKNLIFIETDHKFIIFTIKSKFFFKEKKLDVITFENYKFRITLLGFLFQREWMEYLRKYCYGEYLNSNKLLWKYPLLKTLMRYLYRIRLKKLTLERRRFYTNESILQVFQIIDNYNIKKNKKSFPDVFSKNLIKFGYLNSNFIKFLRFFNKIKLKNLAEGKYHLMSKLFFLKNMYFILMRYYLRYDYAQLRKLSFRTIRYMWRSIRMLWRYGYKLTRFYSSYGLLYIFREQLAFNVYQFNKDFLINFKQKYSFWYYFWYKLFKLIVIEFMHRLIFVYFKYNKIPFFFIRGRMTKGRKKSLDKRIKDFARNYLMLVKARNLFFVPVNLSTYNKNIKNFLIEKKYNFDIFSWKLFFTYDLSFRDPFSYNHIEISKKLEIDQKINNKYLIYVNIYYKLYNKTIKKRKTKIVKNLAYFMLIGQLFWGVLFQSKYLKKIALDYNYFWLKRLFLYNQKNYLNFIWGEINGSYLFWLYYYKYEIQYYHWDYEIYMIWSSYLYRVHNVYRLPAQINYMYLLSHFKTIDEIEWTIEFNIVWFLYLCSIQDIYFVKAKLIFFFLLNYNKNFN
jgi:hypothetical protein